MAQNSLLISNNKASSGWRVKGYFCPYGIIWGYMIQLHCQHTIVYICAHYFKEGFGELRRVDNE